MSLESDLVDAVKAVLKKYDTLPLIYLEGDNIVVRFTNCAGMLHKIRDTFMSKVPDRLKPRIVVVCYG